MISYNRYLLLNECMIAKEDLIVNKLPFVIPEVCTYPFFTAVLAILSAYGKEKNWLYNNYILIWVIKNQYNIDYWVDFKYANELNQEEFCPLIERKVISRDELKSYGSLWKSIKSFIDNKYYVMVSVDVYYINSWWKRESERCHFRHELCIHGYDEQREILIVSDFIGGKYCEIEVTYKEFKKGYINYQQYVPYQDYGNDIILLSFLPDKVEDVDIKRIKDLIIDFINSEDKHIINHIQIENKEDKYVFGLKIIEELLKYLNTVEIQRSSYIDVRPFHILLEMHKVMEWRYNYFFSKYSVLIQKERVLGIIKKQVHSVGVLQGLVLKYNFVGNSSIIHSIKKRLDKFWYDEKEMLEECLAVIDEILNIQEM